MTNLISSLPIFVLLPLFGVAAVITWLAGSRLAREVDEIASRYGLGQAFAGMLLLGGITSLPELAAVTTASLSGDASLAVNNLLGSAAINILMLAIADVVFGRDALTRVVAKPATLMQGVLGMMLLGLVAAVVIAGDVPIGPFGGGSLAIAAACLLALRVSAHYERRDVWRPTEAAHDDADEQEGDKRTNLRLLVGTGALAAIILIGGAVLSLTADGIAEQTGLSSGMIGFLLVAFATSLPELSSVTAAVRAKRYELAVGDIFGTNLFNLALFAVADAMSISGPVLAAAGPRETIGALTALLMTGAFVVGLLERQDRTVFRMGYDAAAAVGIFLVGVIAMLCVDVGS